MSEYGFIVDTMRWSYSRLNSYYNCPYGWNLQYIECVESENNFFSQYGKFLHDILEKYAKSEISLFDLSQHYEDNYDKEITLEAPHNKYTNIRQSYYNKGLEYLNNIDFILDEYEILGVEKEVKFKIGKYELIGYIDLLLRDKKGRIIIIDHKSANVKILKSGKISKTDLKHVEDFKRQLYLYSMAIHNEYGEFPKFLKWNLFNNQAWLNMKFNFNKYRKALKWAYKTIKLIENEVMWLPNPDYYFCYNLCGFRNKACPYKFTR
jgi:hypothetical protein